MKKFSVISALIVGIGIGVAAVGFIGCNKGASSSGGNGVVAVVNGTPITEQEYLHYMMLKPTIEIASNKGPLTARVIDSIGFQAFEDVIQQKLVVQMAKDEGVYPSDAEINKEIQFRLDDNPNFIKGLNAQGLDTDMIKQALAIELSQDNLVGKGITVSDADVDKFIKDNPDKFMTPAMMNMQWILVTTPQAKKLVDDQLSRGQPFDQVAIQYSEAPDAKENHGAFNKVLVKDIPKEILKAVANVQPLHSSDWLQGSENSGWAKFYVVKKTDAAPVKITDHIKELVKRQIRKMRGNNARELHSELMAKEKDSKVDIQLAGLQDMWNMHLKQLSGAKKPPALGSAGTAGTTSGAAGGTASGTAISGASTGGTTSTKTTG